jgi:hypothetical protein
MATDYDAYMNISSNAGDTFLNASNNDMLIFTQTSNQRILIGTHQGVNATIAVSSNQVDFNKNVNINANINVNGTLTQGGQSLGSQFINNGNSIYLIGSNIGLGLSNPTVGIISLYDSNTINPSNAIISFASTRTGYASPAFVGLGSNGNLLLWNTSNYGIKLGTNNQEVVTVTNSGFVGIGQSNPGYNLDINGSINFTGTMFQNGQPFAGGAGGLATNFNTIYLIGSNLGLGISNADPTTLIHLHDPNPISVSMGVTNGITGTGGLGYFGVGSNGNMLIWHTSNYGIRFGTSNREVMRITSNGNVGIGTTNPGYTLEVAGVLAASNLYSQYAATFSNQTMVLGQFTACNNSRFISNVTIDSLLTVNANANITGILSNNVNIINSLTVNSNAIINSELTVNSNASIDGNLNFNGILLKNGVPYVGSQFSNNSSNVFLLNSNLGIGVSNPQEQLHVASNVTIGGNLNFNGILLQNGVPYVGSQFSNNSSNVFLLNSNLGIGVSNPQEQLHVANNVTIGGNLNFNGILQQNGVPYVGSQFSNNSSNVFLIDSNLGIGTSNPQAQLHIASNMIVDGTVTFNNALQFRGIELLPGQPIRNATQVTALTSNIEGYSNSSNGITLSIIGATSNDLFRFQAGNSSYDVFKINGDGSVNVYGNIIPASNILYDLGSSNNRFRDLYLSGTTINLGDTKLSRDAATGAVAITDATTGSNQSLIVQEIQIGSSSNAITISYSSNTNQITFSTTSNGVSTGSASGTGGGWSNNDSNIFALAPSNVGIGKSNPAFALDIVGDLNFTGTLRQGGTPYIGSQWSNNSTNVFLMGSNVGIRTSNPSYPLHVMSNMFVQGQFANSNYLSHGRIYFNDTNFGIGCGNFSGTLGDDKLYLWAFNLRDISFCRTTNALTNPGTGTWTTDMVVKGVTGFVGIGTTAPGSRLAVAGGQSVGEAYSNTAAPTNGMIIQGNVGIGTTTPAYKLDVISNSSNVLLSSSNGATMTIKGLTGGVTSGPELYFVNSNNSNALIATANFNTHYSSHAFTNDTVFRTSGPNLILQTGSGNSGMFIQSGTNNIGIGVNNPAAKLDINGTLRVRGNNNVLGSNAGSSNELFDFHTISEGNVNNMSLECTRSRTYTNNTWDSVQTRLQVRIDGTYQAFLGFGNSNDRNSIYFGVGNTINVYSTATGNFGIGTSNPGSRLAVAGGQSVGAAYSNTAAPTNGMIIQGNVGIGTTTPVYALDVNNGIRLNNTSNAHSKLLVLWDDNPADTVATACNFSGFGINAGILRYQVPSVNSHVFYTGVNERMRITSAGNVGIGTTAPGSRLAVAGGQSVGADYSNVAAPTNGMIIQGNVGIGTSNPAFTLDVNGSIQFGATGTVSQLRTQGQMVLWANSTGAGSHWHSIYAVGSNNSTNGDHVWFTRGNDIVGIERMRITSAGNVGIGTTAPFFPLSVQGTIAATAPFNTLRQLAITDTNNNGYYFLVSANSSNLSLFSHYAAGSTILTVNSNNGFLGLGNTAPTYRLDVSSGCRLNNLVASNVANAMALVNTNVASSIGTSFALYQGSSGDTVLNSATNQNLAFKINNVENMTLNSNGNVGVGTTAPTTKLEVVGQAKYTFNGNRGITLCNTNVGAGASEIFFDRTANASTQIAAIGLADAPRNFFIWVNGADRLNINNAGNVGIGTTTPAYTLDVNTTTSRIGYRTWFNTTGNGDTPTGAWYNIGRVNSNQASIHGISGYLSSINGNLNNNTRFDTSWTYTYLNTPLLTSRSKFLQNRGGYQLRLHASGTAGHHDVWLYNPDWMTADLEFTHTFIYNSNWFSTRTTSTPTSNLVYDLFNSNMTVETYSGNLGVGTANPGSLLAVAGGAAIGAAYSNVAAPTNGMIIQGNVGIGVSNPAYKLDVNGGAMEVTNGFINTVISTGTNNNLIQSYQSNMAINSVNYLSFGQFSNTFNAANFRFSYSNNGNTSNQLQIGFWGNDGILNVNAAGNIGMGTTTPAASYRLDINGSMRLNATNNDTLNKLLVIYDGAASESVATACNFYGFGINPFTLRYQAPTGGNHVFYTGAGELTRLRSAGSTVWTPLAIIKEQDGGGVVTGGSNWLIDDTNWGLCIASSNNTNQRLTFRFNSYLNAGEIQAGQQLSGARPLLINPKGGNVGINTFTPAYPLDVNVGAGALARIGNLLINNFATDHLAMVHSNLLSTIGTSFALFQGSAGNTVLNSASGQLLDFKIANIPAMTIAANKSINIVGCSNALPAAAGSSNIYLTLSSLTSNVTQLQFSENRLYTSTTQGWNATQTKIQKVIDYGIGWAGYLAFGDSNDGYSVSLGSGNTTRLFVSGGGNVGIGTTTPINTLQVSSNVVSGIGPRLLLENPGGGGNAACVIDFLTYANSTAQGSNNNRIEARDDGTGSSHLIFHTKAPGGVTNGLTERMRITSGGNVGIGTSNPGSTLTINGSLAKSSGTFDIEHPINPQKRLVHSFIEGPRCDLIYRGTSTLSNGLANVNLDTDCVAKPECAMETGTFEALCTNHQCYLQNIDSFNRLRYTINSNILNIICENSNATDNVNWMVVGERKDNFIKQWERTNPDGYLITEYNPNP